ncbi:hypothetical protein NN561_005769 [Cricetulus griseus]
MQGPAVAVLGGPWPRGGGGGGGEWAEWAAPVARAWGVPRVVPASLREGHPPPPTRAVAEGSEGLEPNPCGRARHGAAPHALGEIWGLLASRHFEPNSSGEKTREC